MSIQIGGFKTLAGGRRFYAYSGLFQGGVSDPPDLTLIEIKNSGLKDSFVKIQPSFGKAVSTSGGTALGISILIDDQEIVNNQIYEHESDQTEILELFVPRQSKLTVKSINTSANTLQERGVTILGWFL